jgi:hypothetical protein
MKATPGRPERSKTDPGSTENRPKIDLKSTPNRPHIDPQSTQNPRRRPKGVPGTIPGTFRTRFRGTGGPLPPKGHPKETPKNPLKGPCTLLGHQKNRFGEKSPARATSFFRFSCGSQFRSFLSPKSDEKRMKSDPFLLSFARGAPSQKTSVFACPSHVGAHIRSCLSQRGDPHDTSYFTVFCASLHLSSLGKLKQKKLTIGQTRLPEKTKKTMKTTRKNVYFSAKFL